MIKLSHKGKEYILTKFLTRVMLNEYLQNGGDVDKAVLRVEELKKKGEEYELQRYRRINKTVDTRTA